MTDVRSRSIKAAIDRARANLVAIRDEDLKPIPDGVTFRQWCEALGREGLMVDGKPFKLDDRPTMAWMYDRIPTTREEAFRKVLVLMKCAQVGFTVFEMLAAIYLGLKFGPCTVGMFLPDQALAQLKSTERFMPIIRTVPAAHKLMTQDAPDGSGRKQGEGNVRTRRMGECLYIFSWTSGRATTESIPMDFLSFDEVQEMTKAQLEKTMERLSASQFKYTLMGSTANWPDEDIHFFYKQGKQFKFHTACPQCEAKKPLDDYFPDCIRWDAEALDPLTQRPGSYRYVCESGHWIDDPQRGEWIADNPGAWIDSVHFPQFLSPTITPNEIMHKYVTSTDKKNFHNRVLGKPYLDPTQIPVTLEHMANCVEAGKSVRHEDGTVGVRWKQSGKGCFMGIDQMGNFNVVVIKERLRDGRQAVVHLEEIYHEDPFMRCSELMRAFDVYACVVEINPNYNDAKRFANRHKGKVFICDGFAALPDDMVKWGDAPKLDSSDRRTDEEEQDRFTVKADQFKCMQTSMARFTAKVPLCLFPDPAELVQEVSGKGGKATLEPVAPRAFFQFTRTALVVEKAVDEGNSPNAGTNKYRRVVRKVGIDPHFSYANQLCDVAWARAHGTALFILPEAASAAPNAVAVDGMSGPLAELLGTFQHVQSDDQERCGSCLSYCGDPSSDHKRGRCEYLDLRVDAPDPGCDGYFRRQS